MKKILSFVLIIFCSVSISANAQLLGTDVKVLDLPITEQIKPDVDAAFNGWVYDVYSVDTGYVLRVSRDKGQTWSTIEAYNSNYDHYKSLKLVVTSSGTDTTSIRVHLMALVYNLNDFIGYIFINSYDGYTDSYINQDFFTDRNDTLFKGVDIASDYKYPAVGTSPYSVAAAYTIHGPLQDSVIMIVSTDSGANFSIQRLVDTSSTAYFRNVSLSYGRSDSWSNGRYFLAWDEFDTPTAANGRIYSSHNMSSISSALSTSARIDTLGPTVSNMVRNPCISTSANNTDNDSGAITAIITFERDKTGGGADIDILAAYNKQSPFANNWYLLNIDSTTDKTLSPSICFEPMNSNFYLTYFDSTDKQLPLLRKNFNLTSPSTWAYRTYNYADDSLVMRSPFPVVNVNPADTLAIMTWSSPLVLNGVALFDAEFNNSPLAIKTAVITATNIGARNRVDWKTATEDEGSIFIIERSTDGAHFTAIGQVSGKGTSGDYTYWDANPAAGINYYRLRTMDVSNAISYTRVVSAFVKSGSAFSIKAYPNPVVNSMTLYVQQPGSNGNVIITDLSGREMMQQAISSFETSIDMSRFATGIYLVKYSDGSNNEVIRISKK